MRRVLFFSLLMFIFLFFIIRLVFASIPLPNPPNVEISHNIQEGGKSISFSCENCSATHAWYYRKPINIDNLSNSNNLTDYQILVTNPIYNETGLIASWHFNEGNGTIALDSSGNNNNGNLVNGPTWVDGKFGKALSFDGVNDYVDTPTPNPGGGSFTVCAWIKNPTDAGRIVAQDETNPSGGWALSLGDPGTLNDVRFYYRGASVVILDAKGLGLTDGAWHFICGVRDPTAGTRKIYHNGVIVAQITSGDTYTANPAQKVIIGGESSASAEYPGVLIGAIIDEVKIYNRALSDSEIQALYQAKARLDYGDIRFTDSDGVTQLNYWQEADGKFWVKVPFIPANSTKTIYVYYGSPFATSQSNGDATFDYFDLGNKFNTYTVGDAGWLSGVQTCREVTSIGYPSPPSYECNRDAYMYKNINLTTNRIVEWYARTPSSFTSTEPVVDFPILVNSSGYGQHFRLETRSVQETSGFSWKNSWSSWGAPSGGSRESANRWYKMKVIINQTHMIGLIGTIQEPIWSIRFASNNISKQTYFGMSWNGVMDTIIVRKYNYPEPIISLGSEETRVMCGEYMKLIICKTNSSECILNSQWLRRRLILINNTLSSLTLTDYQVAINLTYDSDMQPDFSDIRFTWYNPNSRTEIEIPYWIEKKINSQWAYVWIKIKQVAARSVAKVYVYYKNTSIVNSKSSGDDTFIFFDDFETNRRWIYSSSGEGWSGNYTTLDKYEGLYSYLISSLVLPFQGFSGYSGITKPINVPGEQIKVEVKTKDIGSLSQYFGKRIYLGNNLIWQDDIAKNESWYNVSVRVTPSAGIQNLTLQVYTKQPIPKSESSYSLNVYWDLVIVRKYSSLEPNVIIGDEENTIASDFIWAESPVVEISPIATYICPSCTYSINNYSGVSYNTNQSIWTNFTSVSSFVCKKEGSPTGSCICNSDVECFNYCYPEWNYKDGTCYNGKCYNAHQGIQYGNSSSCIDGVLLMNNTVYRRYLNLNGKLYYCRGGDNSTSPYPFVYNVKLYEKIGDCICRYGGTFYCSQKVKGIIKIWD
ncbi:MAG: DUF2341 domain-containing protein [Candidatus Aenigmatarchaeota archaeon]